MLAKEILLTLIDYDDWATVRIMELAAELPPEQLHAPAEASHGSLHALLFHIVRTTNLWRCLLQTGQPPAESLQIAKFPDVSALKELWLWESERLREAVARLSPAELAQEVSVLDRRGDEQHLIAWHMLAQALLHAMQHRSEAAALLTKYGHSPGDIDFIFYV